MEEIESINRTLQRIFANRGFDFTSYSMSEIQYALSGRMSVLDISDLTLYAEYISSNPSEYTYLFNTILVNTSEFFRDYEIWNFLRSHILPSVLDKEPRTSEIRIWSAGCASGEEAYSIAMLINELIKNDPFARQVKIFATDVDETALRIAQNGAYIMDKIAHVPEELREKYFSPRDDIYVVDEGLRNMIIFGRHDIALDPPISNIDLLLCRNVLIYNDQEIRLKILSRLQYALNEGGYLWLGKAERLTPKDGVNLLRPIGDKYNIYKKKSTTAIEHLVFPQVSREVTVSAEVQQQEPIVEENVPGIIALNSDLTILYCNTKGVKLFFSDLLGNISPLELVGRPVLELSLSPQLVGIKPEITEALVNRKPLRAKVQGYEIYELGERYIKLVIVPLDLSGPSFVLIIDDITEEYERYREQQVIIESLLNLNKEIMSHNNELLSTNKELVITNMNLQSINQELELLNEERNVIRERLRITNQRLKALNLELQSATQKAIDLLNEIESIKLSQEIILNNIDRSIVIIDKDLCIRSWNSKAEELLGFSKDSIGRSITTLDAQLPLADLSSQLAECIRTGRTLTGTIGAIDSKGSIVSVDVVMKPLRSKYIEGLMLIIKQGSPL